MPRRADVPPKRDRNPRGQGEQLRKELLDAAIELLGDLGDFDSLSVRAVTTRVGVTATAFYLHFDSKEELAEAVKERSFNELRRYVGEAESAAGRDPRSQANSMCLAYLRFADERPGYYRVLFHKSPKLVAQPRNAGVDSTSGWPSSAAEAFNDLVRAMSRCLRDDRDPFEIATMVWAGLHGFIGLQAIPQFPLPPAADYVRRLLDNHLRSAR
jgi:AcrR family transcriptional regulator